MPYVMFDCRSDISRAVDLSTGMPAQIRKGSVYAVKCGKSGAENDQMQSIIELFATVPVSSRSRFGDSRMKLSGKHYVISRDMFRENFVLSKKGNA